MIKFWKFFPVLIVLAVCLGLMLVPAMGVFAQPPAGKATFQMPAEVRVAPDEAFAVNVTIWNPNSMVMTAAGTDLQISDPSKLTISSIDAGDWPTWFPPGWDNTTGESWTNAGASLASPNITTDALQCVIHFVAGSSGGIVTVNFTHEGDEGETLIYDPASDDICDWGAIQNMTVIIGDTFNLTVTSDGCCDVVVGSSMYFLPANSSQTFAVPCPNITLTAVPVGSCCDFGIWTVDDTPRPAQNPVTVNGTADESHTANVTCSVPLYNLTMAVNGGGTTNPSGTTSHSCGDVVNVSATANASWRFVNWTTTNMSEIGDPNANSTTVRMDEDKTVTANFVRLYNLTMNVTGSGNVTISGAMPASYPNSTTWDNGTGVNITAIPDPCWDFVNWTGNVADPNSASTNVTVDANKTVTANFAQVNYTLNINVTVGGNVTINGTTPTSYPNSTSWVNCTVVPLTATPDANYTFVNWTGDLTGSTNPTNITVDGNKTVTANFALKWYNLTIDSTAGGNVTDPVANVSSYEHGTVVNLTAEPEADYAFLEWTGDNDTIAEVYLATTNITMYDNYSIWAIFGPHEFDVTPRSLTFTTVEGENPPSQTLEICNTGNGTLNWSVSDNKGWLGESPKKGSLPEPDCEDVKVSVDVAGMKAGDYTAKITFTGSSPTQEVPVRLHIESAMEAMPVLPAGLSASALSISPQQVQPDQEVTISINVANTGGETGSYNAVLYINSVVEDSQTVSVAAGASKNVIFTVSKTQAGVYDVSLAGQSGQFEVVGGGGWFGGGGGLGTGGIIAIVVVVIILIVAVIFIMRGTARPE